jgi:hypothetical protein
MNLAEETFVNQLDAYELQKLQFSEVPLVDQQVLADVISSLCTLMSIPVEAVEVEPFQESYGWVHTSAHIRVDGERWNIREIHLKKNDIHKIQCHHIVKVVNTIQRKRGGSLYAVGLYNSYVNDDGTSKVYLCPILLGEFDVIRQLFNDLRDTDAPQQLIRSERKTYRNDSLEVYYYEDKAEDMRYPLYPSLHRSTRQIEMVGPEFFDASFDYLEKCGMINVTFGDNNHYQGIAEILAFFMRAKVTDIYNRGSSADIVAGGETFSIPLHEGVEVVARKMNSFLEANHAPVRMYLLGFNGMGFSVFVCEPSEADPVFYLFDQHKEIQREVNYYTCEFSMPHEQMTRRSVVYNVSAFPLSEAEYTFLKSSGFSLDLVAIIASASDHRETIRVIKAYTDANIPLDEYANGIILRGRLHGRAEDEVMKHRSSGYYSFMDTMREEYLSEVSSVVPNTMILKLESQFEVLRYRHTSGPNHNVFTNHIIEKLKLWDKQYGVTIYGVGADWVDFILDIVPEDVESYARELYEFCPDCVDQGMGTLDALKDIIREERYICLWWD